MSRAGAGTRYVRTLRTWFCTAPGRSGQPGSRARRSPGQHRNKATQWRRARAVELAINGACYGAIAAEVGYSHRGTA